MADVGYRPPWLVVPVGGRRQQETKCWCFDFPALQGPGDVQKWWWRRQRDGKLVRTTQAPSHGKRHEEPSDKPGASPAWGGAVGPVTGTVRVFVPCRGAVLWFPALPRAEDTAEMRCSGARRVCRASQGFRTQDSPRHDTGTTTNGMQLLRSISELDLHFIHYGN